MSNPQNHTLTLIYQVDQPHALGAAGCELVLHGDGSREHLLSAFRTLLVAMGYSAQSAMALQVDWPRTEPVNASAHLQALRDALGPDGLGFPDR